MIEQIVKLGLLLAKGLSVFCFLDTLRIEEVFQTSFPAPSDGAGLRYSHFRYSFFYASQALYISRFALSCWLRASAQSALIWVRGLLGEYSLACFLTRGFRGWGEGGGDASLRALLDAGAEGGGGLFFFGAARLGLGGGSPAFDMASFTRA